MIYYDAIYWGGEGCAAGWGQWITKFPRTSTSHEKEKQRTHEQLVGEATTNPSSATSWQSKSERAERSREWFGLNPINAVW